MRSLISSDASGSSNVFDLSSYRVARQQQSVSVFFCTRCHAETFQLQADGVVKCTECGSAIRNLVVSRAERAGNEG